MREGGINPKINYLYVGIMFTFTELKVQCEEVTSVVMKVPDVVFAEARESHCKAALACWQDASARFTFDMDQLHQKRVRKKNVDVCCFFLLLFLIMNQF